jgi:hypothetical protein
MRCDLIHSIQKCRAPRNAGSDILSIQIQNSNVKQPNPILILEDQGTGTDNYSNLLVTKEESVFG